MGYNDPHQRKNEAITEELSRRYRRARASLQRFRSSSIPVDVPIRKNANSVHKFQNGFISVESLYDEVKISIYKRSKESGKFVQQNNFLVSNSSVRVDDDGNLHCNFRIGLDWLVDAEFVLDVDNNIIGIKGGDCYNDSFIAIGISNENHTYIDSIHSRIGSIRGKLSRIARSKRLSKMVSRSRFYPVFLLLNIRRRSLFWLLGLLDIAQLLQYLVGARPSFSGCSKQKSVTTGVPKDGSQIRARARSTAESIEPSGPFSERTRGYRRTATSYRSSDCSSSGIGYGVSGKLSSTCS